MRKMAAYVLGRLGRKEAVPRLRVLLEDSATDVRWNAAIALASLGDPSGLPVLHTMIDRTSLARLSLTGDQVEAAMVNALKALALLRNPESLALIQRIAQNDPNLRVRDAARQAMEAYGRRQSLRECPHHEFNHGAGNAPRALVSSRLARISRPPVREANAAAESNVEGPAAVLVG